MGKQFGIGVPFGQLAGLTQGRKAGLTP